MADTELTLIQAKEILTQRLNADLNAHIARETEISATRRLIVALERGAEVEASYAAHVEEDRRLTHAIAEHKIELERIGHERQVRQTSIGALDKSIGAKTLELAALDKKLAGAARRIPFRDALRICRRPSLSQSSPGLPLSAARN